MVASTCTAQLHKSKEANGNEEIRILILNSRENLETKQFQLKIGWSLRFMLGPSLFGKRIKIFTNIPDDSSSKFIRNEYRVLPWQSQGENGRDVTNFYAEVTVTAAGSFHYYFTIDSDDELNGSGYLLVSPLLTVGQDQHPLPLDAIQCQTVISKLLGPLSQWESKLLVAKNSGYNMIHFTPINALGKSNSAYSVKDQHKLNSLFNDENNVYTFSDVEKIVQMMNYDWKILSVSDVVLNHTSYDSPWLQQHPESTYNLSNSAHLRPAYLLDKVLHHFSAEIADGKWTGSGLSPSITEENHLNVIRDVLKNYFLPKVKIHEFYTVNVDKSVEEFKTALQDDKKIYPKSMDETNEELKVIQNKVYGRESSSVNIVNALNLFRKQNMRKTDDESYIIDCCAEFRHRLNDLNKIITEKVNNHLMAAVENVIHSVRYERLQHDGPRISIVSAEHPLVPSYFTYPVDTKSLDQEEDLMYGEKSSYIMAHNGWVMNDDPLRNFANEESNVYLRRELIAWGDSVKLRYGKQPEDSPFLWEHMKKYVEDTARIFYGLRLDNCHSTPIEVAEYLLDAARLIRPNLYVFAELFTSKEETDNIFVNRLGINSLVRESMSAHNSHELGRQVHRYGGKAVGSFSQPRIRPLTPSIAHALFLDQTHDNPSPVEKRSVYDLLPSAALVSMACCASGSNRGYDELVPYHIHVVNESRPYTCWTDSVPVENSEINASNGIIKAKRALNELHGYLGNSGFSEIYVDQVTCDVVAVTRHSPATHVSVILVAHTAFSVPENNHYHIPPLCVPGTIDEIIFEAQLLKNGETKLSENSKTNIVGLSNYELKMKQHIQLHESEVVSSESPSVAATTQIDFCNFSPGAVIAFRVSMNPTSTKSIGKIKEYLAQINITKPNDVECTSDSTDFKSIISKLTLCDLNRVLFRCDDEERDDGNDFGVYNIPNFGDLPYCGLQGIMSVLSKIRQENDLGHPFCENIRSGDWLCEYTYKRLLLHSSTKPLGEWLQKVFLLFKDLPRYLIPCYFDGVITCVYSTLIDRIWSQMSSFVKNGSAFVKAVALGSVQLAGIINSSPLPKLSPDLSHPLPQVIWNPDTNCEEQKSVTLSAGLPHFSVGCMRNWGRDTFIALRGLFLLTDRFQEARYMILAYAGCLRHGLIPNLLDRGMHARYNCRDAVWWWLQCIQEYYHIVPNGHFILSDKVSRIFPTDDSEPLEAGQHDQPLYEVIQEVLQRHVHGVSYRERNAGFSLDVEMSHEGFNNVIGVDSDTGFVFGGTIHNCGTWMDKMGRSEASGVKGKPATPRDGSAVEIVGLCKSTLKWLNKLYKIGHYPYNSVRRTCEGEQFTFTFEDWEMKIQKSFEQYFWISTEPAASEQKKELINRRGIYKDSFNASQFWADYQLRCNFPIAMVVAPELFDPKHAWIALNMVEKILLGPLGMKTLDPSDWAYDGNYINSDSSSNPKTAGGYNYHQGPEWLWPVGYFCRAKLIFASLVGGAELKAETEEFLRSLLSKHYEAIQQSVWHGLPELTNENGKFCYDGCTVQAWSHACLLEVLYDMHKSND